MNNPSIPVSTEVVLPEAKRSRVKEFLGSILRVREIFMIVLILVMGIAMSIFSPYFLNTANFIAMCAGFSMEGLVVVGMSTLLIAGAFDLSVGSVMALSGIIAAWLLTEGKVPFLSPCSADWG